MGSSTRWVRFVGPAIALSAGALFLRAQNVPPPKAETQPAAASQPAAAPASGTQPAGTQPASRPAGTRPAGTQPASQPSTRPSEKITVNFKDASLDAVLDHLSAS